jgi:hypothetical protein
MRLVTRTAFNFVYTVDKRHMETRLHTKVTLTLSTKLAHGQEFA